MYKVVSHPALLLKLFFLRIQVPQQKLFSTLGLTSGSLDVPLTDPRFAPGNDANAPEQIHLNYGSPTSVVVSWVTGESAATVTGHITEQNVECQELREL